MSTANTLHNLGNKINEQRQQLDRLHRAYRGNAAAAYVSKDAAKALDKKLTQLYVNFPRLTVNALAERCRVQLFRRSGSADMDMALWQLWKLAGLEAKSDMVHVDRSLYGAAYVTVWGHANDPTRPTVTVDSPRNAVVKTDPATGEVLATFRTWNHDGKLYGAYITPEHLQVYRADATDIPSARWTPYREQQRNPWGEVPTVPFIRNGCSSDTLGVSAVSDILDLSDANAKILQDALVTSEYHSRPRRWATGLEIEEDEDGNPVDPFGENRLMQSESPETKFGQLPAAELDGYADLGAMVTQHIGSLTGLPPHYLGLHGDQPPNADAVRASETQLVSRAEIEKRGMSLPWATVAGWLWAVNQSTERPDDIVTVWESSETRTPAASADAATKLHALGVPLKTLLRDPLRYEPHEIEQIDKNLMEEMTRRAAFESMNRRS